MQWFFYDRLYNIFEDLRDYPIIKLYSDPHEKGIILFDAFIERFSISILR